MLGCGSDSLLYGLDGRYLFPMENRVHSVHKSPRLLFPKVIKPFPIGSMYGLFTYIYHKFEPNVGKYTVRHMDPMGNDLLRNSGMGPGAGFTIACTRGWNA